MTAHAIERPLGEINTTPLIDVMLVLLIMFVITIPAATHSVDVDLSTGDCMGCTLDPVVNRIEIGSDDTLRWNGEAISQGQLAALLQQTRAMPVEPELQFEPAADASYAVSARTLATIKASGVSKFGFVGNERYRTFASR